MRANHHYSRVHRKRVFPSAHWWLLKFLWNIYDNSWYKLNNTHCGILMCSRKRVTTLGSLFTTFQLIFVLLCVCVYIYNISLGVSGNDRWHLFFYSNPLNTQIRPFAFVNTLKKLVLLSILFVIIYSFVIHSFSPRLVESTSRKISRF